MAHANPAAMPGTKARKGTNPVVVLLTILCLAMVLTFIVDSGAYEREGRQVVAGTFETVEKDKSPLGLFALPAPDTPGEAHPVGIIGMLMAIPEGLERSAGLIFMVLLIGGMFGVLSESGAIDAGLNRLIGMVRGDLYILVPGLMIIFSAGSTFLGLASEYLIVIPVMVAMANRLGLSSVVGLAIVTVGTKVGYIASVTNPLPLTVAQPLVGLPIFSGADVRFGFYLVYLAAGIIFMMAMIRREGFTRTASAEVPSERLSPRHTAVLGALVAGVAVLVYASNQWHWKHHALSAFYIGLSIILAAISGLGPSRAADAFVGGMKKVLMAAALIGVATAVSVVLQEGKVLDTVVHFLTGLIGDGGALMAAQGMFVSQLLLDFLIPSTSGQAAVSMPILGPIGQLSGVEPQTTVLAFLFGNGLTNMITPTSGTLLAYLATAQVGWVQWARFILPLWIAFALISMLLLTVAVTINF